MRLAVFLNKCGPTQYATYRMKVVCNRCDNWTKGYKDPLRTALLFSSKQIKKKKQKQQKRNRAN